METTPDSPTQRKIDEVLERSVKGDLAEARAARDNKEYNRAPRLTKDGKHYVLRTPDGKGYEIHVPEADRAIAQQLLELAQEKVKADAAGGAAPGDVFPKALALKAREIDPTGRVGRMIFEQVEAAAKWDELQDELANAFHQIAETGGTIDINAANKEEAERIGQLIELAKNADGLSAEERNARLHEIDPHGDLTRKAIVQANRALAVARGQHAASEKRMKNLQASHTKTLAIKRSLDRYEPWETEESFLLVLQPNDCSRIHKVREASNAGLYYDAATGAFCEMSDKLERASVFVVKHNWAAAFGDSLNDTDPFKLPFDLCAFEFRVTGNTLIMLCEPIADGQGEGINTLVIMEGVDGVWFTMPPEAMTEIAQWLLRQVRAICVALEAQVAEHSVTRQPNKLNEKRIKAGKPPLRDFHVVDLSRRSRASARGAPGHTGRKVRMHFRRGHWRHYEDHKTWIEWMLVGNPDLGFIDKEYCI